MGWSWIEDLVLALFLVLVARHVVAHGAVALHVLVDGNDLDVVFHGVEGESPH